MLAIGIVEQFSAGTNQTAGRRVPCRSKTVVGGKADQQHGQVPCGLWRGLAAWLVDRRGRRVSYRGTQLGHRGRFGLIVRWRLSEYPILLA